MILRILYFDSLTTRTFNMQKISCAALLILVGMTGCNSEGGKEKVKEPEAVVAQTVKNDTLITVFEGVRPCNGCKEIATEIRFERNVKDTVGRFHLIEAYINKKDSAFQHYEGSGNYKIMPKLGGGEAKGIAFYNMILDDQSHKYIYMLQDSVTIVLVDEKGKPVTGNDAIKLKRSNKKA